MPGQGKAAAEASGQVTLIQEPGEIVVSQLRDSLAAMVDGLVGVAQRPCLVRDPPEMGSQAVVVGGPDEFVGRHGGEGGPRFGY